MIFKVPGGRAVPYHGMGQPVTGTMRRPAGAGDSDSDRLTESAGSLKSSKTVDDDSDSDYLYY
jgi:hypothetical protein